MKFYTRQIGSTVQPKGMNIMFAPINHATNHKFSAIEADVKAYKAGTMNWDLYRDHYLAKLRLLYRKGAFTFKSDTTYVFECFCGPGVPCHRLLLAEALVKCGHEYGGELK